eukprot:scaffold34803_cov199-Amphora_coffeaeformis.AAC.2
MMISFWKYDNIVRYDIEARDCDMLCQGSNGGGGPGDLDDQHASLIASSVLEVSRCLNGRVFISVHVSDSSFHSSRPDVISSLPMLKRKRSYRFLGDAASAAAPEASCAFNTWRNGLLEIRLLSDGGRLVTNMLNMPRKTKRARRSRSRTSFLPQVKGGVNHVDPIIATRTHLFGDCTVNAKVMI